MIFSLQTSLNSRSLCCSENVQKYRFRKQIWTFMTSFNKQNYYLWLNKFEYLLKGYMIAISNKQKHSMNILSACCEYYRTLFHTNIFPDPSGDLCCVILFIFQFILVTGKPVCIPNIHLIFMWFYYENFKWKVAEIVIK